jgi:hypothetical protein
MRLSQSVRQCHPPLAPSNRRRGSRNGRNYLRAICGHLQTQQGVINMSNTDPIGWRGVVYGTPVASIDGVRVGTIREVLGSDSEDIFHGLRIGLAAGHRDVMVPADNVTSMSTAEVGLDLSRSAVEALATYDEVATYHLASVGWLRKHLGWTKDSASDEEPG